MPSFTLFLDSDVCLDLLMQRQPFYKGASLLFAKVEKGEAKAFVSGVGFVNVHYFLRKFLGTNKAKLILRDFKKLVSIANIEDLTINRALFSALADFEDAVQHEAALSCNADHIITRNLKDYKKSSLPVHTPEDFLKIMT